jgi:hypothetical protein
MNVYEFMLLTGNQAICIINSFPGSNERQPPTRNE